MGPCHTTAGSGYLVSTQAKGATKTHLLYYIMIREPQYNSICVSVSLSTCCTKTDLCHLGTGLVIGSVQSLCSP